MGQLLLIALATFGSEDLTCIAAGALIAAGKVEFIPGVVACIAGIYAGDLLLYCAGRFVGRPIARWRPLRNLLNDEKLDRASQWLSERGAGVVIFSRFTPGLRLPTYIAAGLLRTRFWAFSSYFLLAAVIWTPVLVGASALLGKSSPRAAFLGPARLLAGSPLRRIPRFWRARRSILGSFRKMARWEFWPPWLAYLPVVPYIVYLGVRHRCFTLFTAANPGIPSGGFVGESKSQILSRLPSVPDFVFLPRDLSTDRRVEAVKEFLADRGLPYPVVLKPDIGERGRDVLIARTPREVSSYFLAARGDTIVQRFAGGVEFGIFYYRYPGDATGRILSITEKRLPELTGNGSSTIEELILRDDRAVCLAAAYLAQLRRSKEEVPGEGEKIRLVDVGSHCRGAVFLNGAHLETDALRSAIDAAARMHGGFFFGRFDVRSPSTGDLQAGRFDILELNGVSAEATHIYDPSVSLIEAYRVLFRQWRIAFEIGAVNRAAGYKPMALMAFRRLLRTRCLASPQPGSADLGSAEASSDPRQLLPVKKQYAGRAQGHDDGQGEQFPVIVNSR